MDTIETAFDQTPWTRMQSYARWRLFGSETPVLFDYVAATALMIVIDALSSRPGWIEWLATITTWGVSVTATSYYRAKSELEVERLAEFHSRTAPRSR